MKKRLMTEQIVAKLRQADVELGKGVKVPQVCEPLGISRQTCSRPRKLADVIWRDGPADGQTVQGVGEGERPAQEARGRSGIGHGDPQGGSRPKRVDPERRRRAVNSVRRRLGHDQVSQRRSCKALGQPRSTQRYRAKRPEKDRALIGAMRRITDARPRFGCERVHPMLNEMGWSVGLGRVHRLWQQQQHMQVPRKQKKRRRLPGHPRKQRQRLCALSRHPPQSRLVVRLCAVLRHGF